MKQTNMKLLHRDMGNQVKMEPANKNMNDIMCRTKKTKLRNLTLRTFVPRNPDLRTVLSRSMVSVSLYSNYHTARKSVL